MRLLARIILWSASFGVMLAAAALAGAGLGALHAAFMFGWKLNG